MEAKLLKPTDTCIAHPGTADVRSRGVGLQLGRLEVCLLVTFQVVQSQLTRDHHS